MAIAHIEAFGLTFGLHHISLKDAGPDVDHSVPCYGIGYHDPKKLRVRFVETLLNNITRGLDGDKFCPSDALGYGNYGVVHGAFPDKPLAFAPLGGPFQLDFPTSLYANILAHRIADRLNGLTHEEALEVKIPTPRPTSYYDESPKLVVRTDYLNRFDIEVTMQLTMGKFQTESVKCTEKERTIEPIELSGYTFTDRLDDCVANPTTHVYADTEKLKAITESPAGYGVMIVTDLNTDEVMISEKDYNYVGFDDEGDLKFYLTKDCYIEGKISSELSVQKLHNKMKTPKWLSKFVNIDGVETMRYLVDTKIGMIKLEVKRIAKDVTIEKID